MANPMERILSQGSPEKEPQPKKRIVLIRHPEVNYRLVTPIKRAAPGEDINTHSPISMKGLEHTRLLAEQLVQEFPWPVKDLEYAFYSSPIKRARSEAEILEGVVRLSVADGKQIPVPANNNREIVEDFSEVLFTDDPREDEVITKEARKRGLKAVDVWLEREGEKLLPRFQTKLAEVQRAFAYLKEQPTKLDLVVSHGLTIAVSVWAMKNSERLVDQEYKLTLEDLTEIIEISKQVGNTSLTEFEVFDQEVKPKSIGLTPHIPKI